MFEWLKNKADCTPGYPELRASGKSVVHKLLESPVSKRFDMIKAAKKLTLPMSGRTLIFDGETEMYAHADFFLHEYRVGGKTIVESCDAQSLGLSPLEAELLVAHQQGRTSLFEVLEAREHQARLRDLLEPEQPELWLTDYGLSGTMGQSPYSMLLFLRLMTARGVNMTSGVSFVFRAERKAELLRGYEARMKTVLPADHAERRYVFFFQKHLQFGEEQAYQDVTPASGE